MDAKIKQLLECATNFQGCPYKYGAYLEENTENQKEFDCSSFIQCVFSKIGKELPRSTILQAASAGQEIKSIKEAAPGDILFFEGERGHYRHDLFPGRKILIGHVGIYLGNNKMIHATNNNGHSGVVIHDLEPQTNSSYNKNTVVYIKRFL